MLDLLSLDLLGSGVLGAAVAPSAVVLPEVAAVLKVISLEAES